MRYFILLLMCGLTRFSCAQISDSSNTPIEMENYFKLDYDNDFFSATDRYYTQGIILTFIHPLIKHSPFSYALIKLNKKALNYYGLQLEQDVFTPRSIRYNAGAVYYGERPFTAVFFVSHTLRSINSKTHTRLTTQLDLGILGPEAKGEEEQKGIHKALDNIQPQGWEHQLATDYILNYRLFAEKGIVNSKHLEIIANISTRLGTLYTDASSGFKLRAGWFNAYFTNLGLAKNASRKNRFQTYLVLCANGKVVGYNATLQGGFRGKKNVYELPDSSVSRLVTEMSAGIVVSYKRLSLEYSRTYITPEFSGGLDHGWGRCSITICF